MNDNFIAKFDSRPPSPETMKFLETLDRVIACQLGFPLRTEEQPKEAGDVSGKST